MATPGFLGASGQRPNADEPIASLTEPISLARAQPVLAGPGGLPGCQSLLSHPLARSGAALPS